MDWGKPAQIKAILRGKEVSLENAIRLYTHSIQKSLTHFEWYEEATKEIAHSLTMIEALVDILPEHTTLEALNTPTRYEMSLLERVCILHDDVAKMIVGVLIKAGSDPLRANAFSSAVHRSLEMGNVRTLEAMKNIGVTIEGDAAKKALECASTCSVHGLRALIENFSVSPSMVLGNGGNILHRIAQDQNEEQALAKLDYCSELTLNDIPNKQGMYALDIAKRWGLARVLTRLETYYSQTMRPHFPGVHPFELLANHLREQNNPQLKDAVHYIQRCVRWGIQGEHRVFGRTGFGVGAIAIEMCNVPALLAAFLEGETINSDAPEGVSLLGYAAILYKRNPELRAIYCDMFSIMLKQETNIDWDLCDANGTTVRAWIEYSLLEKSDEFLPESVQRVLSASERAKMVSSHRF